MPVFEYRGKDAEGQTVSGSMVGASLAAAAAELEKRNVTVEHLAPVEVIGDPVPADFKAGEGTREKGTPPPTDPRNYFQTNVTGQLFGKVPLSDLSFFFRQLATMLHAGVGMVQTLDTLSNQTQDLKLKSVIRECRDHAQEGRPLSAGIQRYPEVFTPLMISLVRTGEQAGMLVDTLRQISDYIEREIKLRNLIRRVTIYPKVVIGASIFIICVTNWIISAVGGKNQIYSPLTTWSTWVCLAPWLIGLWILIKFIIPNPAAKQNWDRFILSIPYFGMTSHQLAMAKFSRAFAALYRGGVSPPDATLLSADSCGNEHLRASIYPAAKRVKEGAGLTESFAQTGAFSPIALDMIHTGETTGNIDMMLEKLAVFYEDDSETRANASGIVLGVLCLIIVGVYVAYVVITFYAGYFSGISNAANG